uniref:U3 small nucleolar RNA-associated protein 11 n=1 Tax=Plectus sambesii TaxID=2011161 RepID=A0A914UZU5_9BILA
MSSLRKAGKAGQQEHRERSQLESRKHLGELEKKKDYKLRADDYQKKKKKLHVLRKKALDKNPDEFYFHMINSGVKGGIHHEKTSEPTEETLLQTKLMEGQDLRYVRFKRDVERKKIDKLKSELHLLDLPGVARNVHTVFVDSKKEAKNFNPVKYLDTHPSLIDRTFNRPKLDTLKEQSVVGAQSKADVTLANRERKGKYSELMKRMDRERELTIVTNKLQVKKNVAESKGEKPKRVLKGSSSRAPVYKWQYERRR